MSNRDWQERLRIPLKDDHVQCPWWGRRINVWGDPGCFSQCEYCEGSYQGQGVHCQYGGPSALSAKSLFLNFLQDGEEFSTDGHTFLAQDVLVETCDQLDMEALCTSLLANGTPFTVEEGWIALAGKGRGFHGHKGRPGRRGGSVPRGGGGAFFDEIKDMRSDELTPKIFEKVGTGEITMDEASDLFERVLAHRGKKEVPQKEFPSDAASVENAIEALGLPKETLERERDLARTEHRWLSVADPDAKIDIMATYEIFPELKEVRLHQMYTGEGKEGQTFEQFKQTPITAWRGGAPTYGETFATFTLARGAAEEFAKKHGGGLYEIKIRPDDLIGFAPTGATELFVSSENATTGGAPDVTRIGD